MEGRVFEFDHVRYSAVYHINDGFYFSKHWADDNRVYLRCISRDTCDCRASMPLLNAERSRDNFYVYGNHSHGPDFTFAEVAQLRAEIMRRCRQEATDYRRIFDEECARLVYKNLFVV
jgi:hypothetical protein